MERAEHDGRLEEALTHGLKLISFDPLQEHVDRALMRLYATQGRHDAALAQYERCRRELSNQLGVRPEAETEDLARSMRAARREGPAKPWSLPLPRTELERPVTASVKRRIAAIMVGDVVGYSGTMERAEERSAQRLEALISDKIALLEVGFSALLATRRWPSFPLRSVQCAIQTQRDEEGPCRPTRRPTPGRFVAA